MGLPKLTSTSSHFVSGSTTNSFNVADPPDSADGLRRSPGGRREGDDVDGAGTSTRRSSDATAASASSEASPPRRMRKLHLTYLLKSKWPGEFVWRTNFFCNVPSTVKQHIDAEVEIIVKVVRTACVLCRSRTRMDLHLVLIFVEYLGWRANLRNDVLARIAKADGAASAGEVQTGIHIDVDLLKDIVDWTLFGHLWIPDVATGVHAQAGCYGRRAIGKLNRQLGFASRIQTLVLCGDREDECQSRVIEAILLSARVVVPRM
eukprot:Opistho-2@72749